MHDKIMSEKANYQIIDEMNNDLMICHSKTASSPSTCRLHTDALGRYRSRTANENEADRIFEKFDSYCKNLIK